MRDILVTLLVFGSLPLIIWRPYTGILVWSWLSYMNPHRLAWGFAYSMPFAQIVAITLLFSIILGRERIRLPWNNTMFLWFTFLAWMVLSTLLAIYPERAMVLFTKVVKIQLITIITMILINDMKKLKALIWVIVGSIGFFCVKGGVFTLMTGGGYRVYGPADSNITENNALALATLMIIPLMVYLYQIYKEQVWIKLGLGGAIFLSTVSVVGSQSRGALVAIAAVAGYFWLQTKSKMISGLAMVLLAGLIFNFMPQSWHDRMASITNYQEDKSAMGRINAWKYSINAANDRITGAGFNSWSPQNYARYAPQAETNVVAHSIFFAVLADHGWPGLLLFMGILLSAWLLLGKIIKYTTDAGDPDRPDFLAKMLKVSFVAYASGGAFLSLSYFDLPWHLIAISIILGHLYTSQANLQSPTTAGASRV